MDFLIKIFVRFDGTITLLLSRFCLVKIVLVKLILIRGDPDKFLGGCLSNFNSRSHSLYYHFVMLLFYGQGSLLNHIPIRPPYLSPLNAAKVAGTLRAPEALQYVRTGSCIYCSAHSQRQRRVLKRVSRKGRVSNCSTYSLRLRPLLGRRQKTRRNLDPATNLIRRGQ